MPRDRIVSFFVSQAVIWIPLLLGHQMRRRGWVRDAIAKPLHGFNVSFLTPLVYGLGVWRLDRSAPGWQWVPAVMTLKLAFVTAFGAWAGFRLIRQRQTAATFALMLPISNIGHTLAGFVTLLLLSDEGYSYNSLLMWPGILFVILVWLPLARHWGHGDGQPFLRSFARTLASSQALILVGLLAGTALNFARVPMSPDWVSLMKILVFGSTALVMFAMGLRIRFGRLRGYQRTLGLVYAVKFAVNPAVMILLCLAFGVHGAAAGALFIAASAPAGVNVVSFAALYDLDLDLANAGYLWSTFFFMLFVLPLVILVLQLPFFRM